MRRWLVRGVLVVVAAANGCGDDTASDDADSGVTTSGDDGSTSAASDGATSAGSATDATGADSGSTDTGGVPPADCALDMDGDGALVEVPELTAEMLLAATSPATPVDNRAFAMPDHAFAPMHTFSGRLELLDESDASIVEHHAESWIAAGQRDGHLPQFDAEFVQCGRHLLPTQRGRVTTSDPYWDYIVGPGLTWSTPHDDGWSRASFPFALTMKVENCIQNGVMTFLYDDTTVSQVRHQITQETCHFHKFDLWGQSAAAYHAGPVASENAVANAFLDELGNRYAARRLDAIDNAFGDFDVDALDQGITVDELTARGVWADGFLYLDECRTRFGLYPFCDAIALPSFSLAKTAFVGTAMMALAQELSEDPYGLLVADLLPAEAAAAPGDWDAVTLEHLLDMSTGHYRNANQNDDAMGDFYVDHTLAGRLEAAFSFPYQEPPGQRAIYLTPNSLIAAAALDQVLSTRGITPTDAFDYAVDRIYRPIGLPPESFTSLRTWQDGGENNGTAFGGYGTTFTPHGIVRMSQFLMGDGTMDGAVILDPAKLAATMFEAAGDQGAPMNYGTWLYNNGMWGWPATGLGCDAVVPIMFGVSGITVALAPNDAIYFAFNDAQEQPVASVVAQLHTIAPLCP